MDDHITGVEALLRWRVESGAYVAPGDFIPVLEETGLILEVGDWVLREACDQLKRWDMEGLPDVGIAVNVSARQLSQADFADRVIAILGSASIPPERLQIEITESAVMQDLTASTEQLRRLRSFGISVALDDFGTGYSSLSYLKRFALAALKIDRSFIDEVAAGGYDAALASAIIAMASQLGISVIAEGVETQEQLNFLRMRRCDEYQGFLLAPPLPEGKLLPLLKKGRAARESGNVKGRGGE